MIETTIILLAFVVGAFFFGYGLVQFIKDLKENIY